MITMKSQRSIFLCIYDEIPPSASNCVCSSNASLTSILYELNMQAKSRTKTSSNSHPGRLSIITDGVVKGPKIKTTNVLNSYKPSYKKIKTDDIFTV